ncbi:MAG: hypothetical protein ACU0CO_09830 [Shimia sp.]
MSAPDTNVEKQKRRHRGPLRGIAFAVAFAGVLLVLYMIVLIARGEGAEPDGGEVPVATE